MRDLPKQVAKGKTNFEKLNCIHDLSFSQFRKNLHLYNTVLSCLYYYIRVLYFQNLDMTKEQLYTELFFLYFECDNFLT